MLDYERTRQTLTVRLSDDLDHSAASRLRPELDALLKDPSIRRLVLDLKQLRFMDSSGIGLIIGRYKLLERRGGSVAVINADARVDRIFEMSGLYQIVDRMACGKERLCRTSMKCGWTFRPYPRTRALRAW